MSIAREPLPTLFQRVYEVVARIPPGRVVTYGQIARHLGLPRGARAVGWAMGQCPPGLPWHRVVNAQGGLSGRGAGFGVAEQRLRLQEEGIVFDAAGRLSLARYGWDEI